MDKIVNPKFAEGTQSEIVNLTPAHFGDQAGLISVAELLVKFVCPLPSVFIM